MAAGVEAPARLVAGRLLAREPRVRRPRPLESDADLCEPVSSGRDGVPLGPGGREPCGRRGPLPLARLQGPGGRRRVDGGREQARHRVVGERLGRQPEQVGGRQPVTGRTEHRRVVLGVGRGCDPLQGQDCPGPTRVLDPGPQGGHLGVAGEERVAFAGGRGVPAPLLRGRPSSVEVAARGLLGLPERRQRGSQRTGEVVGRGRQLGAPGKG